MTLLDKVWKLKVLIFLPGSASKNVEIFFVVLEDLVQDGHRDRVDEARDLARSVRDQDFLYIRNYMPHLSYNQPTAWPDLGEIRHEFYRLAKTGKMRPEQWHFAGPFRPVEELYDCNEDPQNLNNLIGSNDHRAILVRMRKALAVHLRETRDLGFLPEFEAWQAFKGSSQIGSANHRYRHLHHLANASYDNLGC